MHSETIVKLEESIVPVISAMTQRGLNVDLPKLNVLTEEISLKKDGIELRLRDALGIKGTVNFNSSKDVVEILSAKLGINLVTTRTGRHSTNRRVLKGIHNPVTDEIAKYRDLERLLSSLKARNTGFTETYYGRKRSLSNITSSNAADGKRSCLKWIVLLRCLLLFQLLTC